MKNTVLYYSTKVHWRQSIQEIESCFDYFDNVKFAFEKQANFISCIIIQFDFEGNSITIKLEAKFEAVLQRLEYLKIPNNYKNPAQAKNVAWRVLRDLIKAQLEVIKTNQIKPQEVFKSFPITSQKLIN